MGYLIFHTATPSPGPSPNPNPYQVSDVYLNLFRGVIPAIAGLDISPIAAFFVLNLLTSSVASLG